MGQIGFYLPLDRSGVKEILLLVLLAASPSESQSWELVGCKSVSIGIDPLIISGQYLFILNYSIYY